MMQKIKKHQTKLVVLLCVLFTGIVSASATTILSSGDITYDNTNSGLTASNLQDAIDELYTVAQLSERIDDLENKLDNYWKTIYPVGSIYTSIEDDTAAKVKNRFGGTWVAFGTGQTLVGVNTSDSSFNTVEKTGGSKTSSYTPAGSVGGTTLTTNQIPSHTHNYVKATGVGNHTLTISEIPSHTHGVYYYGAGYSGGSASVVGNQNTNHGSVSSSAAGGGGAHNHPLNTSTVASDATGGGQSHNHSFTGTAASISTVQPYITVYMWKRTA